MYIFFILIYLLIDFFDNLVSALINLIKKARNQSLDRNERLLVLCFNHIININAGNQ